jgi:hypothetical protein
MSTFKAGVLAVTTLLCSPTSASRRPTRSRTRTSCTRRSRTRRT